MSHKRNCHARLHTPMIQCAHTSTRTDETPLICRAMRAVRRESNAADSAIASVPSPCRHGVTYTSCMCACAHFGRTQLTAHVVESPSRAAVATGHSRHRAHAPYECVKFPNSLVETLDTPNTFACSSLTQSFFKQAYNQQSQQNL
jgi:hypothetical protein